MLHSHFMIVISALFLIVSLAILVSLIRHHQVLSAEARAFSGPTGRLQWLWALVPLIILGSVDYALIHLPASPVQAAALNASSAVSADSNALTIASAPSAATSHAGTTHSRRLQ